MQDIVKTVRQKLSDNYDFKSREISCGREKAVLMYISSLCDTDYISTNIIKPLSEFKNHTLTPQLIREQIYAGSLGNIEDAEAAIQSLLTGSTVVVFPSIDFALYCESRRIAQRPVEKTEMDASLKGSKESFNESIADNTGLIRKRVASSDLKIIKINLGTVSNTEVVIFYMQSAAPAELVKHIQEKLSRMRNDLILSGYYIAEALKTDKSLFDTAGYTEKPDTLVSQIFEGRVAILVSGTPFAVTVPHFFIENFQSTDDYYSNRYETAFIRLIRIVALLTSLLLPALYVTLTTEHFSLIPTTFIFKLAVSRAGVPFPTVV